ncbi:MAG: hybrid sensor histidine kinase/response regulator [Cyclobacteriaceae bacterium]|nr:hybrid sensor histidine kinase/response regulator [Cyclobacteriaceae bacterium]
MEHKKEFRSRILVIDDQPNNLKLVSSLLKKKYEVFLSMDGDIGLEIAKEKKPDLILLDIMMPGINGFDVCKKLKEDSVTSEIPVIFLTAKNEDDDIQRAFDLGGVDYIIKPIRSVELYARINTHLLIYHQQRDLKKLNSEINALNLGLEEKVQIRTNKLNLTLSNLQKRNDALYQFSSIISHNLRGPVASILGLSEILNIKETDSSNKEEIFKHVIGLTKNLDSIVRDLTKIMEVRDQNNLELTKVNLREVITSVQNRYKNECELNEVEFVFKCDDNLREVFTEVSYVENVLSLLVSNAINYKKSVADAFVIVKTEKQDDGFYISVEDNGLGIKSDNLKEVFEPYKRFNVDKNGKGLGLYFAKMQVESLGGTIEVVSEIGKGTKFTIMIPQENTLVSGN